MEERTECGGAGEGEASAAGSEGAAWRIQINRPCRPPPLSLLRQVWAMEVSRRCTHLLNSQDGGILTVSVSQGDPETASCAVPGEGGVGDPLPSARLWPPGSPWTQVENLFSVWVAT